MRRSAILSLTLAGLAAAEGNMIGNQSQNEGLPAVPAPAQVAIDGSLAEWDLSGRIWVFADSSIRSRYSAEVAAMHDADHLYIGVHWKDPTPMHSTIDPQIDPGSGWKSDSVQMRIDAGEMVSWLTTWNFAPKQQPVLHIARWKDIANERKGQDVTLLAAPPGGSDLGQGAAMAYKADADGAGYVQEMRIPWKLITTTPGKPLRCGFEFLWGDPSGNTWPIHRYADNMAPGETSREFFWSAKKSWGAIELLDKGGLSPRAYVNQSNKPVGSVPITMDIPAEAARFTLVVEDAQGARIRNLVGDADPVDFAVGGDRSTVQVDWDCLDDAGKAVAAGTYRVRGLWHRGLGATYEQCFYNPGTPPWPVAKGTGAWGADHCAVHLAARSGDGMILAAVGAEGGEGMFCVGPDGLKRWGEKRGATHLAADAGFVYAITGGHQGEHKEGDQGFFIRLAAKDGSYARFVRNGAELPFQLPVPEAFGTGTGAVLDLAAGAGRLYAALDGRVAAYDAASLEAKGAWPLPGVTRIALAADGTVVAWTGAGIARLDPASGKIDHQAIAGVGACADLAVDGDGNAVVLDDGPDHQAKAFARDGKLVYTCGITGGRPLRGMWKPEGMRDANGLAVDAQGRVWVAEDSDFPRRVSLWGRDGKLVRDYIGNTGYAGTGCYLHDQDQDLAYVGPIELKLDRANRSYAVTRVLWRPDPAAGESFPVGARDHTHASRFRSAASGTMREYMHRPPYRTEHGHVVYLEGADRTWRPVAAITTAGHIGDVKAVGPVQGLDPKQTLVWNDGNGDGKVQRGECILGDKLPMGSGWGTRMDPATMTIYVNGLVAWTPTGFAADGAPRYGLEGMRKLGHEDNGDLVPVAGSDQLLVLSFKGYAGATKVLGVGTKDGAVRWTYPNPYPGVHGSHRATMPAPGLIIGPLKILGQVDMGDGIGGVFGLRGNLGQDFFLTTDGLMVGAMFQDGRVPSPSLPATEQALIGVPMEGYSNGGEPFNGWFGRQGDGIVRLTTGMPRQAAMILRMSGLESIRRIAPAPLGITPEQLTTALAANAARATEKAAASVLTIARVEAKPEAGAWGRMPKVLIARPGLRDRATVQLAWDAQNLYARYQVEDATPWLNEGKDRNRLFKTGDAVDLQFGPAGTDRREPGPGDTRICIAPLKEGKKAGAAVMLMRPVDPLAPKMAAVTYTSPVGPKSFDRVEPLAGASAEVQVQPGKGYVVVATLPLASLGLEAKSGLELRGDVGFILSDTAGTINAARIYWANHETNLVNDEPQEAWLRPAAWGRLKLE
ncbi:MAG: hypothetical protein J0M02_09330 [Planctomycetes bacterium]|nr:hypothetical protein [Planctomycetota bacterium]